MALAAGLLTGARAARAGELSLTLLRFCHRLAFVVEGDVRADAADEER
ncbi:MAG TPA: hypothetical protein VEF72_05830 [Mycobacterium sp.]|nr:hypothetical protein [Mycobacterium sp.]